MSISVFAVSLDCGDAAKLANFWSQVLDRDVDEGASPEFAAIGLESGGRAAPVWMFHQVPESKQAKNRVHVDFVASSLEGEVQRILGLGGAHLRDVDENGFQWSVLADPAGNEFCVIATPAA